MESTSCSHEPGGGLHCATFFFGLSAFARFVEDDGVPDSDLTPAVDGRPFRFWPLGSGRPPIF